MLHDYEIKVDNSKQLNELFRENLITEAEQQDIKRKILKDYKLLYTL